MTRWYYTDALAAAWMAKNFGMKFGLILGKKFIANPVFPPDSGPVPFEDVNDILEVEAPLYVHPDSLHLMEPRLGDLVARHEGIVGVIGKSSHFGKVGVWWAGSESHDPIRGDEATIQRNGLAFHWPEQEEP